MISCDFQWKIGASAPRHCGCLATKSSLQKQFKSWLQRCVKISAPRPLICLVKHTCSVQSSCNYSETWTLTCQTDMNMRVDMGKAMEKEIHLAREEHPAGVVQSDKTKIWLIAFHFLPAFIYVAYRYLDITLKTRSSTNHCLPWSTPERFEGAQSIWYVLFPPTESLQIYTCMQLSVDKLDRKQNNDIGPGFYQIKS